MDLVSEFFERDLSAAELEALQKRIGDPTEAGRFTSLAEALYLSSGLAQPSRWRLKRVRRRGMLKALKSLAFLGGVVALFYAYWPQESPVSPAAAPPSPAEAPAEVRVPVALPKKERLVESPVAPKAVVDLKRPERRSFPSALHASVKIQVYRAQAGPVRVTVLDSGGKPLQVLHQGALGQGRAEFEWDGLDMAGNPVKAGVYQVEVRDPESVQVREIVVVEK